MDPSESPLLIFIPIAAPVGRDEVADGAALVLTALEGGAVEELLVEEAPTGVPVREEGATPAAAPNAKAADLKALQFSALASLLFRQLGSEILAGL